MIKYNSKTLNDWYFDATNIVKVYRNGAVVFYKVSGSSGSTPTFNVCYAVVDDITQYQETEFVDVYDKKTKKWYKLNNLNQYEEYGLYGEGFDITYYEGKLTIDNGYEYEWNGSSWVNRGELVGTSKIIKSPEYIERTSVYNGYCSLLEYLTEDTKFIIKHKQTNGGGGRVIGDYVATDSDDWRFFFVGGTLYYDFISQRKSTSKSMSAPEEWEVGNYYIKNTASGVNLITGTPQTFSSRPDHLYIYHSGGVGNAGETADDYGQIWYIKIYKNDVLVRDFIPWTDMNGNYGLYDKVNGETVQTTGQMTASTTINDVEVGSVEYPLHYQEKQAPLDNLSFESLDAAQEYAYNNCVYDSMKATIGGNKYYFDSEDENGWVKVQSYYKFEDVTASSQGGSGWTVTNSDTYNPDKGYYDDFSTAPNSTDHQYKVAKVTIYGYEHFTYYLRSSGYYSASYTVATNIDELQSDPESLTYSSDKAITNTYEFYRAPKSDVNLDNYRRITYNNLDKTVEHTFYVLFYNSYDSNTNATILIPKEQDNENWEQVTFSASSNVVNARKVIYIDEKDYSKNGGTYNFYSRWIIGLPSGNHTSRAYYNNYDYCEITTNSTFTSVAGEQRQVNFTYTNTVNKSLSFRLVDESGNVLTPTNPIYVDRWISNSCGISTSSTIQLPTTDSVKVGGTFHFTNSNNRHYIYGYQTSALNPIYHADDYQDTFDIVYTKLPVEAVTITYTTYDPNDSETPSFNTDITYPYNAATTSSTTLTSYDVPNGYGYVVSCTSDKFSADSQSYTSNYTENPISFVLYPNNREFATVDEMSAYAYAWEGMKATVGDTKYKYKNGAWEEITQEVTVDLNSQWQSSTSYGNITDVENYDFYESFSNQNVNGGKATMFITINGYKSFTFKVRNYSESCCDYVVVNNIDDISPNGNVYYSNNNKSSNTTWYDVTFNNLDGGEHVITVTYKKDGSVSSGSDRGYVAIPKNQ